MDEQQLQITDRQPQSSSTNALTDDQRQALADWRKMRSVCKDREDCLFGNHPTLLEMNESCKGSGLAVISKCLDMMNVYTNKVKLDTLQIIELSQTIFDKFFYLKETEVMLFFTDHFKSSNSDEFYGALEPKTITTMLTKWVRVTRANAIWQHDKKLHKERLESEKADCVSWEQYSVLKGVIQSNSPIGRIAAGLGGKTDKDMSEAIRKSAEELVNNRWGYTQKEMEIARKSFMTRYGSTPEYHLKQHDEYVTTK